MLMAYTLLVFAGGTIAASTTMDKPNFLLLFPDEWRYDWDGSASHRHVPVRTPHLSALRSRGKEFDVTGVNTDFGNDYPTNQTTFYSVLRDGGYHTMATGKDDLTKATQPGVNGNFHAREIGWADWLRSSGKGDVVDKPQPHEPYGYFLRNHSAKLTNGSTVNAWDAHLSCFHGGCCRKENGGNVCDTPSFIGDALYEDNFVGNNALTLLDRKPAGKPWMLHVSFPGPHPPFIVTQQMNYSTAGRSYPLAIDNPVFSPVYQQKVREEYAAEIENLDRWFGEILARVESMGEMSSTIVLVCSDHGEMLGDHGTWAKSKPWEASSHVPLVLAGPGVPAGQVVQTPVATMDMAATMISMASLHRPSGMSAQTLESLFSVATPWPSATEASAAAPAGYRSFVSSGLDDWRMVVKGFNETTVLKLICCYYRPGKKGNTGCPGAPSTMPKYNVARDANEMSELLSAGVGIQEAKELLEQLPVGHDGVRYDLCTDDPAHKPFDLGLML